MSGTLRGRLPVATARSSWEGSPLLGYKAIRALGLAVLVGLLTLLAFPEAQRAVRTWIQRRARARVLSHAALTPSTGAAGGRLGAIAADPEVLVRHSNV